VAWALAVAAVVVAPWLAGGYTLHTAARLVAVGLLAASVAVLSTHAGLPTLGQVAPYAVGAYTTALLAKSGDTTAPVLLVASALTAGLFSAATGAVVTRTRGVVFLMVTLAVGQLTAITAGQWKTVTGGTDGLAGIPPATLLPGGPALIDSIHLYWYVLAVAVPVLVAGWWLLRGPAGLLLRGVRDNEPRMHAGGHPVPAYLLAVYVAAGAAAGVGGSLLVTTQRYVSPADVGFHVAAVVLLAVVIAGTGSLAAAVVAAGSVVALRDWAAANLPGHGPLLLGLLFITAAYLPHILPRLHLPVPGVWKGTSP
jgi:branched-chain amino acid transport system permease protein